MFVPFSVWYIKEKLTLDYLWAALCIVAAAYFYVSEGIRIMADALKTRQIQNFSVARGFYLALIVVGCGGAETKKAKDIRFVPQSNLATSRTLEIVVQATTTFSKVGLASVKNTISERRTDNIYLTIPRYQRYEIEIEIRLSTPEENSGDLVSDDVKIELVEYTSFHGPDAVFEPTGLKPAGLGAIIASRRKLSMEEWDRIIDAQGDLSVIGIDVDNVAPVERFDEWFDQMYPHPSEFEKLGIQ